jgi:hypothetical protein
MNLAHASLIVGFYLICTISTAADLRLDLEVSGTVSGTPEWRSSNNAVSYTPMSSVTFDFGAVISGYSATNVDSDARVIVLADPTNLGGSLSINVSTPSDCNIGNSNVNNEDIKLVFNGSPYADTVSVAVTEGVLNTMKIRFGASGGYGDKSGLVECTGAGAITYSY